MLNVKKSARWRFFLLCLFLLSACLTNYHSALAAGQNCSSQKLYESGIVKYVHDGDTVRLADGRKIRLIGINAPEVANDEKPEEHLAIPARDFLRAQLKKHHNQVMLVPGIEVKDHYQRSLAHLFLLDGTNLQSQLLSSGLAFAITIPPNDQFSACYQKIEKKALCGKKGLWQESILNISNLDNTARGFHLLKARLLKIEASRKDLWLTLEHGLSVRIAKKHLALFDVQELHSLIGQFVIIRGWLQAKKNPRAGERFYMQLKHPSAIEEEKAAMKC